MNVCYAFGFVGTNKVALLKNIGNYTVLVEQGFKWNENNDYTLQANIIGSRITCRINNEEVIYFDDTTLPYEFGLVGIATLEDSCCDLDCMEIKGI